SIWTLLKNPKNTLETIGFLCKVMCPSTLLFVEEKKMFANLIKEMILTFAEKFGMADSYEKGKMIGEAISFVLSFFVSGAGVVKALRILDLLRECKVLSKVCVKVADKAIASKEALAKMLEAAAQCISRARSYFKNAIEDALTEFNKIIKAQEYYEVEFVDSFGNIIKDRIPISEIEPFNISKIDEASGFANKIEQVLERMNTYEQARNKALEIVGNLGHDSKPYIGRLGSGEGKIVGRQSADGKVRWRLDYDPQKGPHINVEDFRNGKSTKAIKIAIPFEGDLSTVETLLKVLNSQ
ncbi:MAG TPA: hypothetical protein VIO64_22180, partial [Pseudobacteroides sp.]|uniref:hypothetical protein n=1 Tax=Pseudobacteroides sp. TaxID=1968840 RepID=UPI002F949315